MFYRIILALLVLIPTHSSWAQNKSSEIPQLVINIHIEGLNSELLYRFKDKFEQNGFKRILNYGINCTNAYANYYRSNEASLLASIHSGTMPCRNGIIGTNYFNPETKLVASCALNSNSIGTRNPNIKNYSAGQIQCSTVEDELLLFYPAKSKVYSVSANPTEGLLTAGHNAQGAFWVDGRSGQWTTTSAFLNALPDWVKSINDEDVIDTYFKQDWSLLKAVSSYDSQKSTVLPLALKQYLKDPFKYAQFKKTPYINTLITDFALRLMEEEHLGKDSITSILNLCYDINDYWDLKTGVISQSREDMYLRMDAEIGKLITSLVQTHRLNNALLVITGSGDISPSVEELKQSNIPAADYDPNKISSLLNSYLMAVYGTGNWVLNYSNSQIYLNHDLIKSSKLNLDEITQKTAELCREFTAIERAIPISQLIKQYNPSQRDQLIINNLYPPLAGDLFVVLKAGRSADQVNTKIPILYYGWKTTKNTINATITTSQIAPTICNVLKIPSPNGCSVTGIPEVLNSFK